MGVVAAPDENAAPFNLDAFFFKDSIEVGVNRSIDVSALNVRSYRPRLRHVKSCTGVSNQAIGTIVKEKASSG